MSNSINICGSRGCGKTLKLIDTANENYRDGDKILFIVVAKHLENIYREKGLNAKIPCITFEEYTKSADLYRDYKIYIDEVPYFIQGLFKGNKVEYVTSDLEDLLVLNRKVWDSNYNV